MKTAKLRAGSFVISLTLLNLFLAQSTHAVGPPDPGPSPLLDSWSFYDSTNWTDDYGDHPISFTNISWSQLGNGSSLVVDTNVPAWLNYEVYQTNVDATNIIVNGPGSITLWFGPNWATTNGGPSNWAQLIDVGEWTSNASSGYFGLSIDPGGSNLWFSSQDGAGNNYSLSTPISWTTNYFHFVALTYSATNVSLYLDGNLATNDPGGLSVWPPANAIPGGVYFGSDTNGNYQARGLFNIIQTFDTVLDSNDVEANFQQQIGMYEINMYNIPFMALGSANSGPSTNSTTPDVITGAGNLQWDGTANGCSYSTNAYYVWITNVVATLTSNGTENVRFSINGGQSGYMYDVFATSALQNPMVNAIWVWMGQGAACNTYTLTNMPSSKAFLILGTPQDLDGDGLTDAYELLVSHTDPNNPDSNLDGILDGWDILLGLNPHQSNLGNPSESIDYSYTAADWINGVSGIKGSSGVSMDNEGNVTQVSQ